MFSYRKKSLSKYLDKLAAREPVPGGGSAAALTAALGVSLISMVANYSKGRGRAKGKDSKINDILRKSEKIRKRLLILVELDAKVYLRLSKADKTNKKALKAAKKKAQDVPREVCRLCYQAVKLTGFLAKNGNTYLVSDIQVAAELLLSAFNASLINIEVNK